MPGVPPMQPVVLGAGERGTVGLLHRPEGPATGVPVLFCAPFGFDEVCSHATRRRWAEWLAAAGHPVLRFDLPGTGDSGGGPRDPDLVEAWLDAVAEAARWLAARAGTVEVAAVGIGLGGLLALAAADRGAPIAAGVLWGVPTSGRRFVRELRAAARMERGSADPDALPKGAVHSGGFLVMPQAIAALGALEAAALGRAGTRLLLLDGADPVDPGLRDALTAAGVAVTVAPGPGFDDVMAEPRVDQPMPEEVFRTAGAWLAELPVTPAAAPPGDDGARDSLEGLVVDGTPVREAPLWVHQPFGRLLGILAEPVAGPSADLCVVLLNAGAQRRIGPNRLYVLLARRCAAAGVPALRLDLGGLGDSDLDGRPWGDVEGFYAGGFADQIRDALDTLQAAGHGPRFAVAGLCSGGYWAVESCLADPRVELALMLNPGIIALDRMRDLAWNARRIGRLRDPRNWLRLLRGDVSRGDVLRTLKVLRRGPRTLLTRLLARAAGRVGATTPASDSTAAVLDRLRDAGKRALLVLGVGERLRDDLAHDGLLDGFDRWPNVDLRLLDGSVQTHELQPLRLQHEALDIVAEVIAREVAATRSSAVA